MWQAKVELNAVDSIGRTIAGPRLAMWVDVPEHNVEALRKKGAVLRELEPGGKTNTRNIVAGGFRERMRHDAEVDRLADAPPVSRCNTANEPPRPPRPSRGVASGTMTKGG